MKIETDTREIQTYKQVNFKSITVFEGDDECGDTCSLKVLQGEDGKQNAIIIDDDTCSTLSLTFSQATLLAKAINKMVKELNPPKKRKK